jgi:hypothetical protein
MRLGIGRNLILNLHKKAENKFFGKIRVQGKRDCNQAAASNFSRRYYIAFAFFEEF